MSTQILFGFVCLGFVVPLEICSLICIWRRHLYLWRAANFDLCSALMTIDQWGFFSVSHLPWHGTSVYNGHLRGPVTLTPIAERLAGELSLPVLTCQVCRGWDSNTQPSACGANAFTNYATAAAQSKEIWHLIRILMVTSRRVWDRLITHCCLTLQNAIPHCPLWEINRSPFDVTFKILLWRRIVPYFKINLSFFYENTFISCFPKGIDTHDRFHYF